MTHTVEYTWTCDLCGRVEHDDHPDGWQQQHGAEKSDPYEDICLVCNTTMRAAAVAAVSSVRAELSALKDAA